MRKIYKLYLIVICLFQFISVQCMNPDVSLKDFDTADSERIKTGDSTTENARANAEKYGGKIIFRKETPIGFIFQMGTSDEVVIAIHPEYQGEYPGQNVAATAEVLFARDAIERGRGVEFGIDRDNLKSVRTLIKAVEIGRLAVVNAKTQQEISIECLKAVADYWEYQSLVDEKKIERATKMYNNWSEEEKELISSPEIEDMLAAFGLFVVLRAGS